MSVECCQLTKRYGRKTALRDVTLRIPDGGVTGLIGPNGAGKSTLIKLITGLVWPTSGYVLVDGYDAHREHAEAMRRVGAVIEWPAFNQDLSATRNLDLFSGGRGAAYRARKNEILRFMELESVAERKVGGFSTGMKQRLGITLALLPDSQFIILDEPTNGLDPGGIVEIRQIIREYNRRFGVTVLVSSHLLGEIEQICDHLIMISDGRLCAAGPIHNLLGGRMHLKITVDRVSDALHLLREAASAGRLTADQLEIGSDGAGLLLSWRLRQGEPDGEGEGGDALAARVNRLLVEAGFKVSRLEPVRENLEAFFLGHTALPSSQVDTASPISMDDAVPSSPEEAAP